MKVSFFTFLVVLLVQFSARAQSVVTITGSIQDSQTRQPLPFCSVALFQVQDSTLVTGLLTGEKGEFRFENVAAGQYYLQAQYIGYSKSKVALPAFGHDQAVVEIPPVQMDPDPRTLRELNVKADRQVLENKIDRQVYRANKFLNSQGGTAIDVLRNYAIGHRKQRRRHYLTWVFGIFGFAKWQTRANRPGYDPEPDSGQYHRKCRSDHFAFRRF